MAAEINKQAPEFTAKGIVGGEVKEVRLTDYKDRWVVLVFYPLDFTPVCQTEVPEFSERTADFARLNAQVLGISTDSWYAHREWIRGAFGGQLNYPLVSDLKKTITDDYGVRHEGLGVSYRATVIIDPAGKVRYKQVGDLSVGRNVDEVLRVLAAFQTEKACPVNWRPGEATL
ncbi:MAG: peroxiredoxin [Planctomycetes bacterium]|nr:peroxiredoxin [Planctomycetota bacterium]